MGLACNTVGGGLRVKEVGRRLDEDDDDDVGGTGGRAWLRRVMGCCIS